MALVVVCAAPVLPQVEVVQRRTEEKLTDVIDGLGIGVDAIGEFLAGRPVSSPQLPQPASSTCLVARTLLLEQDRSKTDL